MGSLLSILKGTFLRSYEAFFTAIFMWFSQQFLQKNSASESYSDGNSTGTNEWRQFDAKPGIGTKHFYSEVWSFENDGDGMRHKQ